MFRSYGSIRTPLPSLHRVRDDHVPLLPRYYEEAPTSVDSARLVHWVHHAGLPMTSRRFAPVAARRNSPGQEFVEGRSSSTSCSVVIDRSLRFLGNPLWPCLGLRPRRDRLRQAITTVRRGPRVWGERGLSA